MKALKASRRLRAYAYGAVTTAIVIAFALAETWAEKYVSDRSRLAGTAVEIAIIVVATLAFRPLHRFVENLVEATFTRRRREARDAVVRLAKELTSFNDASQLLRRVIETVDHHMETAGSAIYLRRGAYAAEASSFDIPAEDVGADDALVIRLRSTAACADPRALGSPAIGASAFPMMAGGHLIGFLALTPKRDEYEPEDRHALATLAEAAGLALIGLDPSLRPQEADRNNLPRMVTSFLGRETETSEIVALVVERDLVTLVGSGGVGKTRSALQVAADLTDTFRDGVWFVELAPLTSGEHIPATVAKAMGLTLGRTGEHLATLTHALKAKHALLVFDNCEHIVEAVAVVVAEILRSCPKVKVLASSRQELDIPGEQTYRLPSLDGPTAIALFADRAASGNRKFEVTAENAAEVADICRRLDGIPLAIELAASKIAVLSLRQLGEKLGERFRLLAQSSNDRLPRQQTLRAMIDWSFDLLDDEERVVFRRLSSFAGGWTLPAAMAVCSGDGIDEWRVLELLSSLVSKSLVVVEDAGDDRRYDMLNSIREYSSERLVAAGEADGTAARHSVYYADFARGLAPLVASLEDVRWLQALGPEIDNIRGALDWAIFRGNNADAGLGLLAQLEWPELVTTPLEAIGWFDAAAKNVAEADDHMTRAGVLRSHARLEWLVGRPTTQRERTATAALDAARTSTDPSEIARALAALGSCYRDAGRFADAEPLFVEAYGTPNELSAIALNEVLRNWAVTDLQSGDIEMARKRFTDVAMRERPGSEAHASALLNLGELEFEAGNVEEARAAARQAKETFAGLRAAPLTLVVCNLAAYAMSVDDLDEARRHLAEALALIRVSGTRWTLNVLEHHAVFAGLSGDHERAAALLGFTNARYESARFRQRTEQHGFERVSEVLARAYDSEELAKRMSSGAGLADEQALACAAAISHVGGTNHG